MTQPTATTWTIRHAHPDDAAGIITLITSTIAEPVNNLLTEPGEFNLTEEQERAFLTERGLRPDWAAFVAVTNARPQQVVGIVTAEGNGRRAIRHRATIGLTIARDWRRQGIGQALMERVIHWARASGFITRLELDVLVRNEAAITLYERLGFQREGVIRHALLRDSEYLDEFNMGLLL